jgi:hypothetical protein
MTRHAYDRSPSFTSQLEREWHFMHMTEVRYLHHKLKVNETLCRWPKSVIYITTYKWLTRHANDRSPSFTQNLKVNATSCRWPKSVVYITTWKWMTRHADDRSPLFTSQPESEWHVMQMTEVYHLHHNLKVNDTSCRWPKSVIYITNWKWMTRHADDRSPSFTSHPISEWHVMQMTEVRHLHHNLEYGSRVVMAGNLFLSLAAMRLVFLVFYLGHW